MQNSQTAELVRYAYERGYRVTAEGQVVSHLGNVRSLHKDKDEYLKFGIAFRGGSKNLHVHRLVAYQKFGENSLVDHIQVRHLNGCRSDNSFHNIEIGSASENAFDKPRAVRVQQANRGAAKVRKFDDSRLQELFQDRISGMKYSELTEKYGVCKATLSYIFNGKTYSNGHVVEQADTTD